MINIRLRKRRPSFLDWFDLRYATRQLDIKKPEPFIDGDIIHGKFYPIYWSN